MNFFSKSASKVLALGIFSLLLTIGASSVSAKEVTVGAKNFTEQYVVGEMMALLLENGGYDVSKKMGTGSSITRTALTSGQIDIYAEYTGTAWPLYLKHDEKVGDPKELYEKVKAEDLERNGIVWLDRSKINNTFALAIRKGDAEKLGTSISELTEYNNSHPEELVFGIGSEFNERPDGIPGIIETYGIELTTGQRKLMDIGLTFEAINRGQIDVAMAYPTDGKLVKFDLLVLEDDKKFFPAYNLCVTVRKEFIDVNPDVVEILAPISELDNEIMQELNYKVDAVGLPADVVAREYLEEKGLI
ncbi:MAG: glycine betaine ABC transporter substrate-binding protein [Synergistota bacterium]|nr:glycine betaine ABC transporter substrate-binding protein [Synergistota bacterium]